MKPYTLALSAWLVICLVFFAPFWVNDKVLAPLDILESLEKPWATADSVRVKNAFTYDAISQYVPYDWACYQGLKEDGYIGWNPYTHNGTALHENHMLCPRSLRHFIYWISARWDAYHPNQCHFWEAWNAGRMIHVFLAGLGMIFLLLSQFPHQIDSHIAIPASLLGAISFAFSSQFLLWLHTDVITSGCCWSPWILWSLLAFKQRKSIFNGCMAVLFLTCGFQCGFLHTTLFNISMVLVVILVECFTNREKQPFRKSATIWFLAFTLLALLLAIPFFLDVIPAALHGGHKLVPVTIKKGIAKCPECHKKSWTKKIMSK